MFTFEASKQINGFVLVATVVSGLLIMAISIGSAFHG